MSRKWLKSITQNKNKIFSSLPNKKGVVKKVDLSQEDLELENRKHANSIE